MWDDKLGSQYLAMDWSSKVVSEWKQVMKDKAKCKKKPDLGEQNKLQWWWPHDEGCFKVNVDIFVFNEEESYSIIIVIRDHMGKFIKGKNIRIQEPDSVFAAESR